MTNDKMLIRNLISREGINMKEIRDTHRTLFGKDMIQDIKEDTSGGYQRILVTIASGKLNLFRWIIKFNKFIWVLILILLNAFTNLKNIYYFFLLYK